MSEVSKPGTVSSRPYYATIVADPPWQHIGTGGKAAGWRNQWKVNREEPLAYPQMSTSDIAEIPVGEMCAANARLFLWATNARLLDAAIVLQEWGFSYRQTLVWHKPDANPVGGSIAPNSEFLIVAVWGKPKTTGRWPSSVVTHPRGGLQHSQKPDVFLDLVEAVSPGPYLEMFARRARFGWDYWGNESLETTAMPTPISRRGTGSIVERRNRAPLVIEGDERAL